MSEKNKPAESKSPKGLTLQQLSELLGNLANYESDPELNLVELNEGDVLFEQGDEGDSIYVLVAGLLGVRVKHKDGGETEIDRLAPGAIVGEMALLSGQKRSATVYALNDAGLISLSQAKFEELAAADLASVVAEDEVVMPRWQRLQLADALNSLFDELDAAIIHDLQNQVEWLKLSNGSIVFRQGDESDGMYLLLNGRLLVTARSPEGEEQVIGEIAPGELVGEFGVITDEPRSATAYAVRESTLAKISPDLFWRLNQQYPTLIRKMTQLIIERQQRVLKGVTSKRSSHLSLALIPAGPEVDIIAFAESLAGSLSKYGSIAFMDAAGFETRFGQEGSAQIEAEDPRSPAVQAWLSELDANNDFLLFVTDNDPSPWTKRAIGQADRVLVVANGGDTPVLSPAVHALDKLEVPLRTELALWHPPETNMPSGTAAWLDAWQFHTHYHVRKGDREHMDRLARRISGRAIALVLSGGGARGYAQMGVFWAIEELGIPIDYVGGTSIGSIMSATMAREFSRDEGIAFANWTVNYKVTDITLPLTALNTSKKVTTICKKLCGDVMIEDLWRPYFCVSSNLSLAFPQVHTRGLMWRAVRASMAIPGVYTPVMEGDQVLVDGGPLNNFPSDVMAELTESEYLIGVLVSPNHERRREYDFDTSVSGWRILFSRLNPFSKPIRAPSFFGTMQRAMEINSVHRSRSREQMVDLLIRPEVEHFSSTNFSNYRPLAEIGYETALEPLREWKETRFPG